MPRPVGKGAGNTWQLRVWTSLENWLEEGEPHTNPTRVAPPPGPEQQTKLQRKLAKQRKKQQQQTSPARVRQAVNASVSSVSAAAPATATAAAAATATAAAGALEAAPAFEESMRLPCGIECMPALLYAWSGNRCGPPELDFLHAVGVEAGARISIYESGGGGLCASVAASSPAMVGCVVAALSEAAIVAQDLITQHDGTAAAPHDTVDDSAALAEPQYVFTSSDTPELPKAAALAAEILSRHDAFTQGVLLTRGHHSEASVRHPASADDDQAEVSGIALMRLPVSFVGVPVCRSNSPLEPGELPEQLASPVSTLLPGIHALHRARDESPHAGDSSAKCPASSFVASSDAHRTSEHNPDTVALHAPDALDPVRLCTVSSQGPNLTAEWDDTGPSEMSISPRSDRCSPRCEVGASASEGVVTTAATVLAVVESEQCSLGAPAGAPSHTPFAITTVPTVSLYFPAVAAVSAAMLRDGLATDAQRALHCVPVTGTPTAAGVKRSRAHDDGNRSTEPLKAARVTEPSAPIVSKASSAATDDSTTTPSKLFASVLGMQLDVATTKRLIETQVDVEPQLCSHQQTWVLVPQQVDQRLAEKLQLSRESKQCDHCGHAGIHFASRRAARAMAQAMSCELFATLRAHSGSASATELQTGRRT